MKQIQDKIPLSGLRLAMALLALSMVIPGWSASAPAAVQPYPAPEKTLGAPPQLREVAFHIEKLGKEGKLAEAHALCQQGYDSATDDETKAFYLRGLAETYKAERSLECMDLFQQVIERYPNTSQVSWARFGLAEAYGWKALVMGATDGSLAIAISMLEQFLKDYPDHERAGRARWALGKCEQISEDPRIALYHYQRAVEVYPDHSMTPSCLLRVMELQQQLGFWDEAIASARRYMEMYPSRSPVEPRFWIVTAHLGKGESALAVRQVDELVTAHAGQLEQWVEIWSKVAKLLYDQGRGADGISFCQMILEQHPQGEQAAFAKLAFGECERQGGNKDQAVAWYRRVLAEHAASEFAPQARFWAGWCLTAEHPAEAIPYFQHIIATDTDDMRIADALWNLAICYGELEDYESSRAAYSDLLARERPEYRRRHAGAHSNIGWTYYRQGRYDEARAELELVISQWPDTDAANHAQRRLGDIAEKERLQGAGGGG